MLSLPMMLLLVVALVVTKVELAVWQARGHCWVPTSEEILCTVKLFPLSLRYNPNIQFRLGFRFRSLQNEDQYPCPYLSVCGASCLFSTIVRCSPARGNVINLVLLVLRLITFVMYTTCLVFFVLSVTALVAAFPLFWLSSTLVLPGPSVIWKFYHQQSWCKISCVVTPGNVMLWRLSHCYVPSPFPLRLLLYRVSGIGVYYGAVWQSMSSHDMFLPLCCP